MCFSLPRQNRNLIQEQYFMFTGAQKTMDSITDDHASSTASKNKRMLIAGYIPSTF